MMRLIKIGSLDKKDKKVIKKYDSGGYKTPMLDTPELLAIKGCCQNLAAEKIAKASSALNSIKDKFVSRKTAAKIKIIPLQNEGFVSKFFFALEFRFFLFFTSLFWHEIGS